MKRIKRITLVALAMCIIVTIMPILNVVAETNQTQIEADSAYETSQTVSAEPIKSLAATFTSAPVVSERQQLLDLIGIANDYVSKVKIYDPNKKDKTGNGIDPQYGTYTQAQVDAYKAKIEAAMSVYNDSTKTSTDYVNAFQTLLDASVKVSSSTISLLASSSTPVVNITDFDTTSANAPFVTLIKTSGTNAPDKTLTDSDCTDYRRTLIALVFYAKAMLVKDPNYYPEQAKHYLRESIKTSEDALNGISPFPFSMNDNEYRELNIVDAGIRYCIGRRDFSMDWGPSIGLIYDTFCFYCGNNYRSLSGPNKVRVVLSTDNESTVVKKLNALVTRAQSTLASCSANMGTGIGQYPPDKVSILSQAIQRAIPLISNSEIPQVNRVSAVVDVMNAEDALKQSILSQTLLQKDAGSYLVFTKEQLDKLRIKVKTDPLLSNQYNIYKANANTTTIEDTEDCFNNFKAGYPSNQITHTVPNDPAIKYMQVQIIMPQQPWDDHPNDPNNPHSQGPYKWMARDPYPPYSEQKQGYYMKVYDPNDVHSTPDDPYVWKMVDPYDDTQKRSLVFFDDISISEQGGDSVVLENPSMEVGSSGGPKGWTPLVISGNPDIFWNSDVRFTNTGSKSLGLRNPTKNDSGGWQMDQFIPVTPGKKYDIKMNGRVIHNKLSSYIITVTKYYRDYNPDIDPPSMSGQKIYIPGRDVTVTVGSYFSGVGNPPGQWLSQNCQTNAICYAIEQDPTYAIKAKNELMYILKDECQGITSWYLSGSRPQPENKDFYGAVQIGRLLTFLPLTYDLIRYPHSNVISPEEDAFIQKCFDYLMNYLQTYRDNSRGYFDETAVNQGGNWKSAENAGIVCAALAFPSAKNSPQRYLNGFDCSAKWLLPKEDGYSWAYMHSDATLFDSNRYYGEVLPKYCLELKTILVQTGQNYFVKPLMPGALKISDLFAYLIDEQTPPYVYKNNNISVISYGDSNYGEMGASYAGQYCSYIAEVDKVTADKAYELWARSGKPIDSLGNESAGIQAFFTDTDYVSNPKNNKIVSKWYNISNQMIFKNNFGEKDEKMAILIGRNPSDSGHLHNDYGQFQIWDNQTPLISDPGMAGYWDSDASWYKVSVNHACLTFNGNNTVWQEGEGESFLSNPMVDYGRIKAGLPSGCGSGYHKRNFVYVKNGFNIYIVWDQVVGATVPSMFTLPIYAKPNPTTVGNKDRYAGFFGTDVEITSLEPSNATILHDSRRIVDVFPKNDNGANIGQFYRKTSPAGTSPLAIIQTLETEKQGATSTKLDVNNNNIYAYKVQNPDGNWFAFAANNSASAISVDLPFNVDLVEILNSSKDYNSSSNGVITGPTDLPANQTIYPSSNDKVTLSIPAGSIIVLKPKTIPDPKPASAVIKGQSSLVAPAKGGTASGEYYTVIKDQYGIIMTNIESSNTKWSLISAPAGATVDENGVVTINDQVKPGTTITLKAETGSVQGLLNINVVNEKPRSTTIEISGPSRIQATGKAVRINYSAIAKDQNGNLIDDCILWSLPEKKNGISINNTTGEVLIDENAIAPGDSFTVAARSSKNMQAIATLFVTVVDTNTPTKIKLSGPDLIEVPAVSETVYYSAQLAGQEDTVFPRSIVYSLKNAPSDGSITIDPSTGALTVTKDIPVGTSFAVVAAYADDMTLWDSKTVMVTDKRPVAMTIHGDSTISVPSRGRTTTTYTATVTDKNNNPLNGLPIEWSLGNSLSGVSINSSTGELYVQSATPTANVTIVAAVASYSTVTATMTVSIVNNNTVDTTKSRVYGGSITHTIGGETGVSTSDNGTHGANPIFMDIDGVTWAKPAIEELAKAGVVVGKGRGIFAPNENVTRAEFIKMLINALSLKDDSTKADFSDVEDGQWYCQPIAVAQKLGIAQGYEDGSFGVDKWITREEMAVMAYRAVQKAGIQLEQKNPQKVFTDQQLLPEYAVKSISMLQQAGVINGMEDGSFAPKENSTRAQAAKIIYELFQLKK